MPAANLTRVEAEQRAASLRVHDYDIALDLSRGDEHFRSETTVRFDAEEQGSTFIEACSDRVLQIELNGERLDVARVSDGTRIRLERLRAQNVLRVVFDGSYTHTGEGLHRFVDPVDGQPYLYTELAVAEANRVFAVFDQPDLKASFRITVTAPADWQVLSTTVGAPPQPLGAGEARFTFAPGPVMSSYIVALIAGPYVQWTGEAESVDGRRIPLGLFTRASLARYAEPAVMFETVRRGLAYYEASYGVAFPYEKYDQIFVPEYNWGAMENIGAVTFNEGYLFRSKVSEARKQQRTIVILHELSHMWFGNLVTMRWWNDLWLNESFATWTSMIATAEATEYTDAWATFTTVEKTEAAEQDQLPSTHPIVASIENLEDVEVNFDGITYDKGASVLKQLVAWVGLEHFYAGIGMYLRRHREGNATLRDLLDELEAASGRELTGWAAEWLETAGVNTLRAVIETDADDVITAFRVQQTAAPEYPTLRAHRLAIGFYDVEGDQLSRQHRVELDVSGEWTEVPALVGLRRPALVLVNDDDLTYATIRLDERSLATALQSLDRIPDPVARALIWGSVWDAVRHAEVAPSVFARLVLAHVAHETQSAARAGALAKLELVLERYLSPEHADAIRTESGDALWALTELAAAGSDLQLQLVRTFAHIAIAPAHLDLLAGLLDASLTLPGLEIDTDLRWELLIALATGGRTSDEAIAAVLATDDTAKGRLNAATARAARPDAAGKHAAWLQVATDATLSNDEARAIATGWRRAVPADLLAADVEPYFTMLQQVWAQRSFTMAEIVVDGLFPAPLVSDAVAERTRAWLAENDGPPALRRVIVEALSELERALAAQECDTQALHEAAR
ncbi:aminopeptidase N [Rathayibacter sp. YIM 133350]|uniref:aminopeptidase N n=1 Tax=Rathayibacter sp. YIM 133350 TaxID=3131992 RepID=UPI00307DE2E0